VRIATLANAAVIHTRRWVEYFRARGHDVTLFSLEPAPAGLSAVALPRAPLPDALRYPLARVALKRALEALEPDLVDAHYVPNYGLLAALCGVRPWVVTAWGSDLLVSAARDPLRAARTRFVLRRADHVLADSDGLVAAARAGGAPADRVTRMTWGVELDRFRPAAAREPGLLLSTRMHEEVYDLPTLLRGVARVMAARPQTRLVIAGDGSLRPTLEREAQRLLPAGRHEFVGRLAPSALADWLARAEIYLSASRSDSTSVSLLEAMASGAIPVVTDLEGNREWVGPDDGARLFPPGDAEGLAVALLSALDDAAWAERARARNRRVVAERGEWNAEMGRIEALFEALARPHAGIRRSAR
jgi:glycosyltransferase involved in cell wall biosynthesis